MYLLFDPEAPCCAPLALILFLQVPDPSEKVHHLGKIAPEHGQPPRHGETVRETLEAGSSHICLPPR